MKMIFSFLLIICFALSQTAVIKTYQLSVQFKPEESAMNGSAVLEYNQAVANGLKFYLHGELRVDSIRLGDQLLDFESKPVQYYMNYSLLVRETTIKLDQAANQKEITVYYSGYFNPSKARSQSDYMRIDASGVFLRSYGYSLWFPIAEIDQSYTVDFKTVEFRLPAKYRLVFTGERLDEQVNGDQRIAKWRAMQTNLFDAQCVAQEYDLLTVDAVQIYYLKDRLSTDNAQNILTFTKQLISYYKSHYRSSANPNSLYIVEMPKYGNISSGNMVGISSDLWQAFATDEFSKIVLAHELVHPFVIIPLDKSDPLYALSVEGFPSYFHFPALAELMGQNWYKERLQRIETDYRFKLEKKVHPRGGSLPPNKAITAITDDEIGVYKDRFILNDRVLLFLNYLKLKMAERFFPFLKELFNSSGFGQQQFVTLIAKYLPGSEADTKNWLNGTDFPERFAIPVN